MSISQGNLKQLAYKKETSWGVLAGATGAKLLRRTTGMFDLERDSYTSAEIRTDYQIQDFRLGFRKAKGTVDGELSPGSYADFVAAGLARQFTAGPASAVIAAMNLNAATFTMSRGAGSYITEGFKVGDVVRATGYTTPSNNARNIFISGLSATVLTYIVLDGGALTTEATATNVTITFLGKKTFAPLTGHTDDSFTFEEFYPDIPSSEVYVGNKVDTMAIDLPPTGLATIKFGFKGKDLGLTGVTQYFTTPTALSTSGIVASVNGALIVNGVAVAIVTSLSASLARNLTASAVVGANTAPDMFEGRIVITGSFSAYFLNNTFRDLFINETESSLAVALTTSGLFTADVISIVIPRVKLTAADKDDGEKGIIRTYPFQALLNSQGGAGTSSENTTISIQDSLA